MTVDNGYTPQGKVIERLIMASGYVLVGIVLLAWCQPISVVSHDQKVRLPGGSKNINHLEKNNIAVNYHPQDTLKDNRVVNYLTQETIKDRLVVKHPTKDNSVVKYPTQETIKGRNAVKYPTQNINKHVLKPCGDGLCLCNGVAANCLNQGRNLSYIPKLPNTTTFLNFSLNYLPYLDNTTFFNLTSLNLMSIELGWNKLTNCSSDAFGNLKHLRKFVITNEKLMSESLKRCLASIDSHLNRLYLFGLKFTHGFRSDLFSEMKNSSVKSISMDSSDIKIYNQSVFSNFTELDELYLCNCQLNDVTVDHAPNLKSLSLTSNHLLEIPDFCKNGGDLYPKLTSLFLNFNALHTIPIHRLECLKSLTNLSISNNNIIAVEPNTFSGLPKLKVIFLEYNHDAKMVIKDHAFNSSSLTHLYLQDNKCRLVQTLRVDALKYCPNLKVLDLQGNKLQQDEGKAASNEALHSLLGSLSNLEELILSRTRIEDLPDVIPQRMPKLKRLYAHDNYISQWPNKYFYNLTHLRELDLWENKIALLKKNSFSEENWKSFTLLDFQKNPFSCSCDLIWFLDYLKTDNNQFEHWPDQYTCDSPSEFHGILLKDVSLNDHICLEKQISSPIIYVTATLMTLVFCISIVYRYRWKLRYVVYMIRFQQDRYQRMHENDGNLYDLYLSSSEENFDFILEHIVPKLENELELRLYIPQRDGIGYKVDAIVTNMDASKKALLFVSDSYIQDQYCQLEATIAFDRYVSKRRNMMIVVLLNELQEMNGTIHTILNVDEYIMWSDGEENVRLFWRKLENSIQSNDDLRC